METLKYISKKYNLDLSQRSPIEIPNVGRNDLAKLFCELDFKVGAEIGVEQGRYAEVLCKSNPSLHLYCVDCWEPYQGYRDHINKKKFEWFYEESKKRLGGFDCELVKKFSMEAVKDFKPKSLDFVYIDSNHEFSHVVNDISEWIKRIRPGGIIAGHDYRQATKAKYHRHVVEAVQGYTRAYRINPWFILGRRKVAEGETREKNRSWFWVQP